MSKPNPLKIVSLISSGTEILCRLGLQANLVGISHECDYPESIRHLPVLSEPRLDPKRRGSLINRELLETLNSGLSIYNIKTDLLESLAPDLIITQDQCEVCAVSLKDVERAVCHFTKKGTRVCTLTPHTLDNIHEDFMRVGEATGTQTAAAELITQFWIQLNAVNAVAGTGIMKKPKVLCLEWLEPPMVAGGWIPEIVRLAGAEPVIVTDAAPFKTIDWETALDSDPDVIAILPCGYPIEKTLNEMKDSALSNILGKFRATQAGNCFVCDGNNYFNRPGPRIADSCEIVACLAHPEKFQHLVSRYIKTAYLSWRPQ